MSARSFVGEHSAEGLEKVQVIYAALGIVELLESWLRRWRCAVSQIMDVLSIEYLYTHFVLL